MTKKSIEAQKGNDQTTSSIFNQILNLLKYAQFFVYP